MNYPTPDNSEGPFTDEGGTTTLMGWSPVYDKKGRPLNADPNTSTSTYIDRSNGKRYFKVSKEWVSKYYTYEEYTKRAESIPFLVENTRPNYLK